MKPEDDKLKAGLSEISGVSGEQLAGAIAPERSGLAGIAPALLIVAGVGLAAVGIAALLIGRRTGLSSFYEEESSPTLH